MKLDKIQKKEIFVTAPPAKAYTLRAILLSGLADGTSRVRNPLLAADQLAMIDSLQKLGIEITREPGELIIHGKKGRFTPKSDTVNLNESGVGMNFLTAATSFAGTPITLTGAEGLLKRPITEVVNGLKQLGCGLEYQDKEGFPPIKNMGTGIPGGTARMEGEKTSQYFSSLAVSAPYAQEQVIIECVDEMSEKPYFDITLEIMEIFGVKVDKGNYKKIIIPGGDYYKATDITIEGDYSSASYFFIAAAVCGNTVHVKGLNRNSLQGDRGMLPLLEEMGCTITWEGDTVTIKGAPLKAVKTDMGDMPDMVPSLAIAAAFAEGTTVITNVGRLRFKECNRLEAMVRGLEVMGIKSHYDGDNLYVEGGTPIHGGTIDTFNDHRIAMCFAAAGLATGEMVIDDEKCVSKSFPDFWERLEVFYG